MKRGKIFGIGLSKTGTSTLNKALEILGFASIHYPMNLKQIEAHDAATDIPIAAAFERLDSLFPNSKFIYTIREREEWLESCRRLWMAREPLASPFQRNVRLVVFGGVDFDPERFKRAYQRHENRVLAYFAERPRDLLTLDICGKRAGWETLCPFLGVPILDAPFPWVNKGYSVDEIVLRLAYVIGDGKQIGRIAGVSSKYVERLIHSQAFQDHDPHARLPYEEGWQIDAVIARACSYFGSVETAASKLKMPRKALTAALARMDHQRRIWRISK